MAHNAFHVAVTSFEDVAALVVCKEKGNQLDLGVGLKPPVSRKLVVLSREPSFRRLQERGHRIGHGRLGRKSGHSIHRCKHHGYNTRSDNFHRVNVTVSGLVYSEKTFSRRVHGRLSSLNGTLDSFREDE